MLASELPSPRLQEFVRLIGLPATMLLAERFGGLRIYIPTTATVDHPFAELIGSTTWQSWPCTVASTEQGMDFYFLGLSAH